MSGSGLDGCRVLVVEDDAMLTMLLEDLLAGMGCVVAATAARLSEATDLCESVAFDVALLDVNLRGEQTFGIAETLKARGKPFVLATGYGEDVLPACLRSKPLLQKPYRSQQLQEALLDALHDGRQV